MHRTRRSGGATIVVAFAVMVLSAAAVAPAAGALSMKACQLVTAKDVQGVLGGGYTAQDMLENQIMSQCAYTKGKETAVSIRLQQTIYDSAQYLKMEQAGMKQQGGGVNMTPVGGLGEGAFYFLGPHVQKNPGQFQLHFGKGNKQVIISVVTGRQTEHCGCAEAGQDRVLEAEVSRRERTTWIDRGNIACATRWSYLP